MIIWLASYPKSGNTLLRSMLSAYLFSEDGVFNFQLLNNIKQFPAKHNFEDLGIDTNNRDELIKNSFCAISSKTSFFFEVCLTTASFKILSN